MTYSDVANPELTYVITSEHVDPASGYQNCTCEDGHASHVALKDILRPGGWQFHEPRTVLTPSELSAFLEKAQQSKLANERAAKEKAQATSLRIQADTLRYISEYNHLTRRQPDCTKCIQIGAKNIRTELKHSFPGHKFSVRSTSYSGGDEITISWSLGPTENEVKTVTDKYLKGTYRYDNACDPTYHYKEPTWTQLFGGTKHITLSRDTANQTIKIAEALCLRLNIPVPEDGKSYWKCYPKDGIQHHNIALLAENLILETSYPPNAKLTGIETHPNRTTEPAFSQNRFKTTFVTHS